MITPTEVETCFSGHIFCGSMIVNAMIKALRYVKKLNPILYYSNHKHRVYIASV